MRSNPQDLDRKYLNCTRKLETEFCQSQTSQTGRMDRSDQSLELEKGSVLMIFVQEKCYRTLINNVKII